jgi:hypothetical protein
MSCPFLFEFYFNSIHLEGERVRERESEKERKKRPFKGEMRIQREKLKMEIKPEIVLIAS